MTTALGAVAPDSRAVIEQELEVANPALLEALRNTDEPTQDQRQAVEDLLADSLMSNFDENWVPNAHGLQIERAISAFLEVWPIYRC